MIETFDLEKLVLPLQEWFRENARVLPWRENPKAYYVWISEIMLQQTRVEAVKPYFDRFIEALPDVEALANCPEDKLLKLWEGLGYYNRVRNLKIAANQILEKHEGVIPQEYDSLCALKGIGSYTAGAISSIAYGRAVPAVDGNVLRVISRVTADSSDIMKMSTRRKVEDALKQMMNNVQALQPAVFNQALMELGATVCVPNGSPHCEVCPWKNLCQAREKGLIDELPVKTKAKARRIEKKTVLILKDGERLALHKRENTGLLAGLYELPNVEGHLSLEEVEKYVETQGYEVLRIQPLEVAKHIFSHVEWQMIGYVVFLSETAYFKGEGTSGPKDENWFFVELEETKKNYAIPSAFGKYVKYLNLQIGKAAIEENRK